MSGTTSRRTRPMAMSSARRSPRGGSRRSNLDEARAAPGVARDRYRRQCGQARRRAISTPPGCSAAPRSIIIIRRSRSSSPTVSNRRAPPHRWSASNMPAARAPTIFPPRSIRRSSRRHRFGTEPDSAVGNFAGGVRRRAGTSSMRRYTTPDHSHAMMEPHATIAAWEGDKLTVWTSNQMITWSAGDVAKTLGIPKENVRVDLALYRRRFRRQIVQCAPMSCWRRSAPGRPSGRSRWRCRGRS